MRLLISRLKHEMFNNTFIMMSFSSFLSAHFQIIKALEINKINKKKLKQQKNWVPILEEK